jgi:Icc-related predicted phosphoesterase
MRVLASADLHGVLRTYEWLVGTAKALQPDALILAGDLLGAGESYETVTQDQAEEARLLQSVLQDVDCPILYIMGNDDWIEAPFEGEQFISLHGRRVEMNRYHFVGYQYSLRFMGGIWEKSEAEIEVDLAGIASLLDSDTVLVTHSPARGILDGGHGSESLASLLEQRNVRAHIHGHSHSSFGRLENHFNVSAGHGSRAMMVDLATIEYTVLSEKTQWFT